MRRTAARILLAALCLAALRSDVWAADAAAAVPTAAELANQALEECEAGRRATERSVREKHFVNGQTLAERAVVLDDKNAEAHFAVFCNMGEYMRLDGESISSVLQLNRLTGELDKAIELRPDYGDALAAKGTMLVRLPRLLGGDAAKGEEMLRQVARQDPNAFTTRIMLAKQCHARGEDREAMEFAQRALQIARDQGRADKIATAEATLTELGAGSR
jgi:hypothetical protein